MVDHFITWADDRDGHEEVALHAHVTGVHGVDQRHPLAVELVLAALVEVHGLKVGGEGANVRVHPKEAGVDHAQADRAALERLSILWGVVGGGGWMGDGWVTRWAGGWDSKN